jgi:DNA gyrase subunit A
MGRASRGVRGMTLPEGWRIISLLVAENEEETVLVASENGYGKRTRLGDFRRSKRGAQGVKAIAASDRNGKVVAAKLVTDEDEVMLITTGGILIRTRVSEIRELSRATQGVRLITLDAGEKLSGLEKVAESEEEGEEEKNGTEQNPENEDGETPSEPPAVAPDE